MRLILAVLVASAALTTPALAQQKTPLAQCLLAKTTAQDRDDLTRWTFAAMAASPKVKDLASVTPGQRDQLARRAGGVLSRLLTQDCRTQTVAALRKGGMDGVKEDFGELGRETVVQIMKDPAVASAIGQILKELDVGEIAGLLIEGQLGN